MWLQFFAQNAHFAIHLFAALVCLGVCWLYLDAWANKHAVKELLKWLGFAILGLSFLAQATSIEQTVLGTSSVGRITSGLIASLRILGFLAIIVGNLIDPLQAVPKNTGLELEEKPSPEPVQNQAPAVAGFLGVASKWLMPIGGFVVAGLYWRRATKGLERHLKPVARAFVLIALSDLLGLFVLLRATSNPLLYNLVSAFGWIWWLQQITLLAGSIILGMWTWFYLTKRFFTQLYMIFIGMAVVIFLIVSVGFTALLLRNVQDDAVTNLNTAAQVLNYALDAKKAETSAAAKQLSGSSVVSDALMQRDRTQLSNSTNTYLVEQHLSDFIVTDQFGQVLLRGQDSEQWGDSLSSDILVKRAILGLSQSTVAVKDGVGTPTILLRSATPIKDTQGAVVGAAITELELNTAFVDGIKQTTGLQSSIYADNVLVATTLLGPDGKSRPTGAKLTNQTIQKAVLKDAKSYSGTLSLQNRATLAAFVPVKDADNAVVGMLLVAQPESSILKTAGHSVELTFVLTAILLVLCLAPVFFITRVLVKQLD